jgi:CRISPR-associated protein Cas2
VADRVWLLVMFDLPVRTKEQRRSANQYRMMLYDRGFAQVQFSVYSKYLLNASGVRSLLPWLRGMVPPEGEVRVLRLTDEQWAGTYRYYGAVEVGAELAPTQLELILDDGIDARALPVRRGRDRSGAKRKPVMKPDSPSQGGLSGLITPT